MEVLELWEKNLMRTKSQRTTEAYLRHVKNFLSTTQILDEDSLIKVSSAQIFKYADSANLGPTSMLANLSALKHFFKFLLRREYIDRDRFTDIEQAIEEIREELNAKKNPNYPKALTKEEVDRIFSAVRGKRYEKIYSLFLYSGIRLGEFEHLSRNNFYLDKSGILWIRLEPYMTKRNKGRLAPVLAPNRNETYSVTDKLLKWIENYEENFSVKRGVLQVYTDRLSKRLSIPFSIHSFRHTYITNLVNSGFPVEVVKEFAGHSNIKTTIETYYKFSQRRAEELVRNFLTG
ncbi:integrase/recombinase XerD [Hydrogenivirga caldilitoris]|uniref:Integrase/recombinase XerD n=1 Tax=Hydrogenivirga caldilitoris TaxID=246264 RepID=A0A497XPL5_9AQUI|nr:tyrosine-type recombinase/integrase [Hydrogenivirga caldilitoris]RLJ70194.1 integrase/recombinase XerD [Hydrogenivirga caldilitoris]